MMKLNIINNFNIYSLWLLFSLKIQFQLNLNIFFCLIKIVKRSYLKKVKLEK